MSKDKIFALHSVAKQVKRTFNHGKIEGLDENLKLEYLIDYWDIISEELDEQWADIEKLDNPEYKGKNDFEFKLLELTGFIAWSLMGPQILGRSYAEGMGLDKEHVRLLVRECGAVDWRKDGQYHGMTGEYGAAIIKRDMERLIPGDHSSTDEESEK